MWRHGGVLVVKNKKHFSPLGTKLYFHVNSSKKNSVVLITNTPPAWPPCHVVASQEFVSELTRLWKELECLSESRFKSRLQNSSYFCVFKYTVRTNSLTKTENAKRGWRETLGFFLPPQTPVGRVRLTRALLARVRLLRCSSLLRTTRININPWIIIIIDYNMVIIIR